MSIQAKVGWRSFVANPVPASIVTSGLVLNLDAGNVSSYSGTGTTWTDLSSTGNNGTLVNGVGYTSANGGALTFDGVNDYVNMGNNTAYNLRNISVSVWVKPTTGTPDFAPIISRYNSGITNLQGWFIYYSKPTSKFYIDGREDAGAYLSFPSTNTYSINNWYNVTWTKSASTWSLYINGVLDRTANIGNGSTFFQPNNMQIGGSHVPDSYYGKQDIPAVNIYNRALSQGEVTQNFDATKTRFGYSTLDTDAQAFITAASITDTTQQNAVNTLVTQLKTYGIWTKLKAVYPFVGGTSTSHKFNLKDPRDVDAAFRLQFNGGWVHSSNGALPNGTTGYADTFFIPSTNLGAYSVHLSYYSRTNRAIRNSIVMGAWQDAPTHNNIHIQFYAGVSTIGYSGSGMFDGAFGNDYASYVTGNSNYFLIGNKTAINLNKVYENGVLKATSTITSTRSLPNVRVLIGAEGRGVSGATNYDNLESAFASIGDGLTDTEASNFYTSVQTFQTTLGRQVGVPIVADTDAQAFLNAAEITSQTQATAVNTLVTDLKSANIWTKLKAVYPFVGGTATSHKFNLKDPRDLDAAYRLVFNGGWVHSSTGALPNGTTGYADTKLNVNNILDGTHSHLSYYSRTTAIPGAGKDYYMMGAYDLPNSRYYAIDVYGANPNVYSSLGNFVNATDKTIANTKGLFLIKKESNNIQKVIINNTLIDTQTQLATLKPNYNIGLAASIYNSGVYGYSTFETAFASIGDGLTDAEATAFYTAVQKYQTSLGRQV